MSLYEASFKTTDDETFKGWMGTDLPIKKGFTVIKLETAGALAYFPNEEVVEETIKAGKIVNLDAITIAMPEMTIEPTKVEKERPLGGMSGPMKCKPGSKLDQIRIMMDNNPGKSRAEYITMTVAAGLSTEKGASTYLNSAKAHVKEETLSGWSKK